MAFVKYKTKDNAFSTLLVGISAGATSLQVQAGAGVKFPSYNFVGTIVQYTTLGDETSAVVKREKVLVSNNATDTFTITRGFDGDTPVAFNAGDFIYLHNVSAITEDIQDEVTRLETAKLNIGALRTGLATAWRFFFSNGSNAETGLAFGTSGTVLTSNGATSSPTFETPTVSIVGLTADTSGNMDADYLVKNNGTGANTKILVNKYKASDAEVLAGSVQNKFVDPKQLSDLVLNIGVVASANIKLSADTSRSAPIQGTLAKIKEIQIGTNYSKGGTARVTYDLIYIPGTWGGTANIYKNGNPIGTQRAATSSWVTYSQDFSFVAGDFIQIYGQTTNDGTTNIRNFRISFDEVKYPKFGTVITN